MKAMLLAAGRGERMRPLTDTTPKPLLAVGGKPLIVWHIERLVAAGMSDIIINHAWLGRQIEDTLGNGSTFGARLAYSPETGQALETAGGIAQALWFFGNEPFLVMNGDVWTDWLPHNAVAVSQALQQRGKQAWLLLVDNPGHHPAGDFFLGSDGLVSDASPPGLQHATRHTFAGIGVYHPELFTGIASGERAALGPLLRRAMNRQAILGSHHDGRWTDVGTPERLHSLDAALKAAQGA